MLRIFVETSGKNYSEEIKGVNVQYISFDNICSSNESLNSFKLFIEQYLKCKDEIVILTVDSRISKAFNTFKPLFNSESIIVINSSLPMSALGTITRAIINDRNKSLKAIEQDVNRMSEMFNLSLLQI